MLYIVIIFSLILLNGFFAFSEIALVSSRRALLEIDKKKGSKGAEVALNLLSGSENFLSAIQIGITLIGIVNGVYGGANISSELTPIIKDIKILSPYANQISIVTVVLFITYFSIVLGELVPKSIAISNPERIAKAVSRPIYYFSLAFYPFVRILSISTSLITKLLRINKEINAPSELELKAMLKAASIAGVIEKEQDIIHEKVFYFSDKKAKHLMTHRTDVEWIDLTKGEEEIIKSVLNAKHNIIIACNQTLDNLVGIISIKDFLTKLVAENNISIHKLITEPIIVPSNIRAQKVLDLFRENQKFIAVVVDEYGSFEGIITLHDIMENLVGDIPTEGDESEPDVFLRDDLSAFVNGDAPIEVLSQFIDDFVIDFEDIPYSTVAGFIIFHLDKIPKLGDRFEYEDHIFEIIDLDGKRIDKIMITKKDKKRIRE